MDEVVIIDDKEVKQNEEQNKNVQTSKLRDEKAKSSNHVTSKQKKLSKQERLKIEDKRDRFISKRPKSTVRKKFKRGESIRKKARSSLNTAENYELNVLNESALHDYRVEGLNLKRKHVYNEETSGRKSKDLSGTDGPKGKKRTIEDIQNLLLKLSPRASGEDEIRRNIFLRKQAVKAISEFTSTCTDEEMRKALLSSKVNAIEVLHNILRDTRSLNGTVEIEEESLFRNAEQLAVVRNSMHNDAGYEILQGVIIKKEGGKSALNEVRELKYYMYFNREIATNCLISLANIASGPVQHVKKVVSDGCHRTISDIIEDSKDLKIVELAIWGIGNCANDLSVRENLFNTNVLKRMCAALDRTNPSENLKLFRTSAWTFSNLTRNGVDASDFPFFSVSLDEYIPIRKIIELLHVDDEDVILHSCWAVSNLTQKCSLNEIQVVLENGILPRIVELMMHPHPRIQWRSLRTVGNILSGDNNEAQSVLDSGALTHIKTLLDSNNFEIRRTACFALSNVTAINASDIVQKALFAEDKTLPRVIEIANYDDMRIRIEAIFAMCNAIHSGNHMQRLFMVRAGCIDSLIDLVEEDIEPQLFLRIMSSLLNLLTSSNNKNWGMKDLLPTSGIGSRSSRHSNNSVRSLGKGKNLVSQILHKNGGWRKLEACKESKEYTENVLLSDLLKFR